MSSKPYQRELISDVDFDAFEGWLDWPDIVIQGDCPRCKHLTQYRQPLVMVQGVMPLTVEQEQRAYEALREAAGEDPKEADFTVLCLCREEHSGRPEESNTVVVGIGVSMPGGEEKRDHREVDLSQSEILPDPNQAEDTQKRAEDQLKDARASATSWRLALIGAFATVVSFGVFTPEAIDVLVPWAKYIIVACLVLMLFVSLFGFYMITRAAFGNPKVTPVDGQPGRATIFQKAKAAARDIQIAIVCTTAAIFVGCCGGLVDSAGS